MFSEIILALSMTDELPHPEISCPTTLYITGLGLFFGIVAIIVLLNRKKMKKRTMLISFIFSLLLFLLYSFEMNPGKVFDPGRSTQYCKDPIMAPGGMPDSFFGGFKILPSSITPLEAITTKKPYTVI